MSEGQGLLNGDLDSARKAKPCHWQGILHKGAGQYEEQGFEDFTPEEQKLWEEGKLTRKIAIGQVSIRLPVQSTLQLLALSYGYLPFIIPIWWAIWALEGCIVHGKSRFFPLFGLCIAGGFALINETVTKQICKRTLPASITDRPPEAVCRHPGMPSGHVMNAYTLMVWCLLEACLCKWVHFEWVVIILVVMGPVPWARVHNRDHTVAQVAVSATCAVFMGSIAYYIRKTHFPGHGQPWDWYSVNKGLQNPYAPKFL